MNGGIAYMIATDWSAVVAVWMPRKTYLDFVWLVSATCCYVRDALPLFWKRFRKGELLEAAELR